MEARFGQQELVDPDELPGRGDAEIDDDDDLRELIGLFEKGEFADRTPVAVEPPFALVLAGQVVRGRIDAVYAEDVDGADGFLVVDWKTNRAQTADPLQLALYRVAWAELTGVPVERVRAAFYYVRTGDLVEPASWSHARSSRRCWVRRLTRRDHAGMARPGDGLVGAAPSPWAQGGTMTTRAEEPTTETPGPAGCRRRRSTTGCSTVVDHVRTHGRRCYWDLTECRWECRPDERVTVRRRGRCGQPTASIASRAISTMSPKVSWRSCAVVSSPVTMWSETVQIASARLLNCAASV